jgi:hypothetical protein
MLVGNQYSVLRERTQTGMVISQVDSAVLPLIEKPRYLPELILVDYDQYGFAALGVMSFTLSTIAIWSNERYI